MRLLVFQDKLSPPRRLFQPTPLLRVRLRPMRVRAEPLVAPARREWRVAPLALPVPFGDLAPIRHRATPFTASRNAAGP